MTTFPRACPSSRYRMASGTSASGYVLSITGVIFPDSVSSLRTRRSSWFSLLTNVPSFCPTNGDSIIARSWRSVPPSHLPPPSPPTMTRFPWEARARLRRANEEFPPMSRINPSMVPQGLQCDRAHDGENRGLLEGEVRRLGRELVLPSTNILGVGALSDAEHLIAWLEPAHVLADRLHDPGHVRADDGVLGRSEAVAC